MSVDGTNRLDPSNLLTSKGASLPPSGNEAHRVYETLRCQIESGTLRPGVRLAERTLARKLGVSRTPVREALHRLEVQGLVQLSNGETAVADHGLDDLHDLCVAREGMEGLAARLAAAYRRDVDLMNLKRILVEIESAVAGDDLAPLAGLNHAFHEGIWTAARNQYLAKELRLLRGIVDRLQGTTFVDLVQQRESLEERKALLAAVEARDSAVAESVTRRHFQHAMALRLGNLGKAGPNHMDGEERE